MNYSKLNRSYTSKLNFEIVIVETKQKYNIFIYRKFSKFNSYDYPLINSLIGNPYQLENKVNYLIIFLNLKFVNHTHI